MVDARLAERQTDGWRYDDMPEDGEAWRESLADLDADAELRCGTGFADLRLERPGRDRSRPSRTLGAERWHGWPRDPRLEPVDPLRLHRLLLPPVRLERDRASRGPPTRAATRTSGSTAASRSRCADARPGDDPTTGWPPDEQRSASRNESAWLLADRARHQPPAARRTCAASTTTTRSTWSSSAAAPAARRSLQRLARAGWRVVALDAGPFWDPETDWVSDEAGSHHLYWTEPRVIAGDDPVPLGSNNSGRGVGGSMVHYAGYTPRFHPSDFQTLTQDGVGADWPLAYDDLRPYYERHRGRAAGRRRGTGRGATRTPTRTRRTRSAATARSSCAARSQPGITAKVGPVAIANGRFGNRPHCIYRGFCLQGCKVNAKASPLITHIPDALAHGAEVRADAMVTRVEVDERTGQATGVHYVRDGVAALPASPDGRRRRLLDRDAAAAAELGLPPRFPTGCATTSTRSAAT